MYKFTLLMYMSEFRLRVSSFLIIGNSKLNHLGAQGTFKEERHVYMNPGSEPAYDRAHGSTSSLHMKNRQTQ